MDRETGIKLMQDLLRRMVERKGSDLFITAGFPPAIKIDGEIKPQTNQPLTPEQSALLVRAIMNDRQTKEFDATQASAISPSRRPASAASASARSCRWASRAPCCARSTPRSRRSTSSSCRRS